MKKLSLMGFMLAAFIFAGGNAWLTASTPAGLLAHNHGDETTDEDHTGEHPEEEATPTPKLFGSSASTLLLADNHEGHSDDEEHDGALPEEEATPAPKLFGSHADALFLADNHEGHNEGTEGSSDEDEDDDDDAFRA